MNEGSIGQELSIRAPGPALLKKKLFLGRFPLTAPDFSSDTESWSLQPDVPEGESKSSSWLLDNPNGSKPCQKGVMEGGLSGAASYFVLIRQEDEFIAIPVEHWFNFKPLRGEGDASLEQVESDMKKDAIFGDRLVPKSVARKEQEKAEEGEGAARKRKRPGTGQEDDEVPEDLYEGVEDELRPERPEQAEDWEHEHNVDDDDEEMGDELEEKLEDDPGERKKLGLQEEEEEELDEAGRTIKKLVERENKEGSDDETDNKDEPGEDGANDDELDEMDEETMDLDEVFKDEEGEPVAGKGARNARAASPAPAAKVAEVAGGTKRRTPPPTAARRATPPPPAAQTKRKGEGAGDEQAKRARVDGKPGASRAPLPSKPAEAKQEGGPSVKAEPGAKLIRATPSGGSTAQRRPAPPPAAGAGTGLPTPDEIKQVVGSNRYSVKALISHFKGRIRKEDTALFQKTVLSVAKLSKGADGQSYLELK